MATESITDLYNPWHFTDEQLTQIADAFDRIEQCVSEARDAMCYQTTARTLAEPTYSIRTARQELRKGLSEILMLLELADLTPTELEQWRHP